MSAKVSIITPVYNAEKNLALTLESVLSQSYHNWEMLCIDDGSTDHSIDIIQSYCKRDPRIILHQNKMNMGAGLSRNKGIELAQGQYIAFLDADDLWLPDKLHKQVLFMQDHKHAFTYTAYQKFNSDKTGTILKVPKKVSYKDLLKTNSVGCLTAMYNTEQLGKMFFPNLKLRQDYCLWLAILKKVPYAYGINQVLAQYRVDQNSLSGNKLKAALYQWKVYRDIEKLPLITATFYFLHYALFGFIKHMK